MDSTKIRMKLGWKPRYTFEEGIKRTIKWYLNNTKWIEDIMKKCMKVK